jgi:hypothetical protein
MIHAYDTLMDSLATLAVEAVCTLVTAGQSYWLAVYQGLPVAAWLERLEILLTQLETLPNPIAYQFEVRHVPRILN